MDAFFFSRCQHALRHHIIFHKKAIAALCIQRFKRGAPRFLGKASVKNILFPVMCLDEGNTFLKTLIALFCRIDLRRPQNTTDLFCPCLHKFFCRSPSTVFVISCNKITKDRVNSTVEQYKRHTIILYRMKRFGQAIVFFQCARCYHS